MVPYSQLKDSKDRLEMAIETIIEMTHRHSLEVGFNHNEPTKKELEKRLEDIRNYSHEILIFIRNKYYDN
jgi:hypothetical protein